MNKKLYLTDEQYVRLLDKSEEAIKNCSSFQVIDSTDIGNKYTTSNVGLCNEDFTEKDTALFPKDFEKYSRKSMKYRLPHHVCPFDNRLKKLEKGENINVSMGCYYTCTIRQKTTDKDRLFDLVERAKQLMETRK